MTTSQVSQSIPPAERVVERKERLLVCQSVVEVSGFGREQNIATHDVS